MSNVSNVDVSDKSSSTTAVDSRTELFESASIPSAVVKLCVPTIFSSLVTMLYNLADTFFVGMLNNSAQNAGVTLAAPVILAFNAVNNLFGVGTSSRMSRSMGSRDYDTVYKSSAIGFYSALFFSAIFALGCTVFKAPLMRLLGANPADAATYDATSGYFFWTVTCGAVPTIMNVVLSYLVRAEGAALYASIGVMSGCILNIVLDPIFILPWGFNMGAAGAGLATFISNCVACLYFFVLIWIRRKRTFVCLNPARFSFNKGIFRDIFSVGVPASIQNLLNVTGMTVLNNFTAAYNDGDAIAAMGIANKISMMPMYISNGMSQGIVPLISYNFASKNIERMKKALIFTVKISMSIIILLVAAMIAFSSDIVRAFLDNDAVVEYGSRFLTGFALALPFLCFDFVGVAVFQACGMGGKSLVFAILRKIVLEIPALVILNAIFPLYGLAYAQLVAEVILAAAAAFVLVKMFRNDLKQH